jgi:hypothetical protein
MNSDFSSSKGLCFSSAACCWSSGRSRTSWPDSAEAMTSTSVSAWRVARLEDHAAHARVQRQLGQLRPMSVSSLSSSTAPSSDSSA